MTTTLTINDMHCASCVQRVQAALDQLSQERAGDEPRAIFRISVNPARRQVYVEHDDRITAAALIESVERAGFRAVLTGGANAHADTRLTARFGVAGIAMMQIMMAQLALYAGDAQGMEDVYRRLLQWTALVFCIPVVAYGAAPLFKSALAGHGRSMDVPAALAIAIAFIVSVWSTVRGTGEVYFDSVAMFTFLLLGARLIKQRITERLAVEADLLSALPRRVDALDADGNLQPTDIAAIVPGDRLLVREGDALPVDGRLVDACGVVEVAHLTGESDWQPVVQDAPLLAGAINRGGPLQMQATSSVHTSRLGDLNAAAAHAAASKHHLGQRADRIAKLFVPLVLSAAVLTWLGWRVLMPDQPEAALAAALAVLVVSCPCALSLATPAAITAAIARLLQAGVLVRRADVLERIPNLTDAVLDKTGTLSEPRLDLHEVITHGNWSRQDCIAIAASLQRGASHPIARAFDGLPTHLSVDERQTIAGGGVLGTVDSWQARLGSATFSKVQHPSATANANAHRAIHLSLDGEHAATFLLRERLRPDAEQAMAGLAASGLNVTIQSGDRNDHTRALLDAFGVAGSGERAPEDKHSYVRDLGRRGSVMFVGDGLNDLAALAESDVAVTTLESADLVKSRADVVLLTGKLSAVLELLHIAPQAVSVIRQNLAWALAYNVLMIPLAAFGWLPAWAAALGMAASSVLVLANAARLLRTPLMATQVGNPLAGEARAENVGVERNPMPTIQPVVN